MDLAEQILYEDNHLLALNKRCGEIVQGDKTGDETLPDRIKAYLKERDNKPGNVFCGVIHRLDRPVSGVVLFAKTSKALSRMNEAVKQREMQKSYWALCKEAPLHTHGHLEDWLLRNEKSNKSYVVKAGTPQAKLASLDYRLVGVSDGGYHLLEVDLHSGRHHQIRAQLANIGCPIKGDLKYGAERSNPDGGISLHARRLSFIHPVRKEPITIVAPPPNEAIWQYFLPMLEGEANDNRSR
ncbi:MAG: RluA family pseudouridine synthase [Bacteroidales bacterium]|nr:RluA family pseudouridine synthase [Bacteroidales bacterium]